MTDGSVSVADTAVAPAGEALDEPVEGLPRRRIPLAGLARVAAVAIFLYIGWYQSIDFTGVLMLSAIWGVAAVGLGLVLGSAGQMSLCQASFVMIGAYAYGTVAVQWSGPTIIGLVAAPLLGGAIALLVSPVLRARGYYLALATIALSLLATLAVTTGDWVPGGTVGIIGIPALDLGVVTIDTESGYALLSSILLAVIIYLLHRRYGVGAARRAIQALHHDEELLGGFGGNASRLKRRLFIVGGALGGLAGGLYAGAFGYVSSNGFGLNESFGLALAVFIGGNGRLLGALLGAVIYQVSFTVLGSDYADYRFALLGAIVILSVHFFPSGLLPSRHDFAGWLPRIKRQGHAGADAAALPELGLVEPMRLSMTDLTKSFGALTALAHLTLEVRPGTLTALVGPNGAGKTTLLDLIAAEQPATSGQIKLDGADVTYVDRVQRARMGIARTYQRLRLVKSLTVLDNALLGVDRAAREEGHVSEDDRLARAHAALAEVGLTHRAESSVEGLTFGERRLVEMARAIGSRPRLVLLDEPSSGLNDAETAEFAEVVRRLHATGCTVLLVEHNLPFVRTLAEDVIALDRGKLLAHGDTETVFGSPEFQRAYVGVEAAA